MTRIYNPTEEKSARRALRRSMPSSEVRVWAKLRDRQLLGCKFRRQYGVGRYVLDFYCASLKLAIEIDGDTHAGQRSEKHDALRQRIIESFGIRFLRFTNSEVHENFEGVLETIAEKIRGLIAERTGNSNQTTSPDPSLSRRGDDKDRFLDVKRGAHSFPLLAKEGLGEVNVNIDSARRHHEHTE